MKGIMARMSDHGPSKNGLCALAHSCQPSRRSFHGDDHEGEEHASKGAAGDITGREKDAVALVAFGDEFVVGESGGRRVCAGCICRPATAPTPPTKTGAEVEIGR